MGSVERQGYHNVSAQTAWLQVLHAGHDSDLTSESAPLEAGQAQMWVRVVPKAAGSVLVLDSFIDTPLAVHVTFCALAAMISAPRSAK